VHNGKNFCNAAIGFKKVYATITDQDAIILERDANLIPTSCIKFYFRHFIDERLYFLDRLSSLHDKDVDYVFRLNVPAAQRESNAYLASSKRKAN
jgi:hypothetical protein